ncbi:MULTISPECIES: non-homologous end-joining DNA ligase [unclassified Anaeromyxobacter]|uniref:non-homologous end-joining DNA ligase n=1 Tax=unclassified Anaeromyxobacter TaxID=2620896 RepID=UPI001F58294E|nr:MULTISPECIES: non-homologous end-joining DNA ligase [unclassified Anaeromyxobacter]
MTARPKRPAARRAPASEPGPKRPAARRASASKAGVEVEVGGRRLVLKNLDKVFYPEAGFTKGDVVDYYARIAPALLPHLAGRPLTMKRYPEGVEGMFFYEKRCPPHRPEWVHTAKVWSERNDEFIDYCVVNDLPSLIWAASIADLELHTSLSLAHAIDTPTTIVFDLDPGPPADVVTCCDVALLVRKLLHRLELEVYPKTSGSKGLQLYVPLGGRATYDETKPFAHAVAQVLERGHPKLVVERMKKDLRVGKVLVDWSQNDPHKTTVSVYSLRARARPTVSAPVTWAEVEKAARTRRGDGLVLEAKDVLRRVERMGDLFEPVLTRRQRLPGPDGVERVRLS